MSGWFVVRKGKCVPTRAPPKSAAHARKLRKKAEEEKARAKRKAEQDEIAELQATKPKMHTMLIESEYRSYFTFYVECHLEVGDYVYIFQEESDEWSTISQNFYCEHRGIGFHVTPEAVIEHAASVDRSYKDFNYRRELRAIIAYLKDELDESSPYSPEYDDDDFSIGCDGWKIHGQPVTVRELEMLLKIKFN